MPIALLGPPLMRDDFDVFDKIEAAGGFVALDATDSGERTVPRPFDRRKLRDEPLLELADAYFGGITHPSRRPDSEFYRWLGRELAERGIRGIILRRYVWCDTWHAELRRLQEWSELPVMDIDVEDGEAPGRSTRIQAFIEMLT